MHSTLPSIPEPPSATFYRERPTPNTLNITWRDARDNGGAAILSYVLQIDNGSGLTGGAAEMRDMYTGPERSFLVEGLQPGRRYLTRVSGNGVRWVGK